MELERIRLLNDEIEIKKYDLVNLEDHIKIFVDYQSKETTKNNYNIGLTKFYNYLKGGYSQELNQSNINTIIKQYKRYLENETELASTSIDNYTEIVKVFCNSYLGFELQKIKRLNDGKTQKVKYLQIEDIKGLINTVEYTTENPEKVTRDKAIICTLFGAGLRISELLTIKLIDYDPDKRTIDIIGKGKAKDQPDTIALPNKTNEHIKEYLQQRNRNNRSCKYLFCSMNDKQLTRQTANKVIKNIAREYDTRNGKNITPKVSTHSFRHSLARYCLVNKGLPISQVKDMLRHSNIETTAKYLENSQEEIQELRLNIF